MEEILNEILKHGNEGFCVDYKISQYPIGNKDPKKHELIKDVLAMANHPSNEDKYIIIGVKQAANNTLKFFDIGTLIDDASYQQFVESYTEPRINFEYKLFAYEDQSLAYFRIFNNNNRPYLIKKQYKDPVDQKKIIFEMGDGFIRKGTSTYRLTRNDFDSIYKAKNKLIDRKDDIQLKYYLKQSEDDIIENYSIKYLDISIENISNKSISVDIEIELSKSEHYNILSEYEVRKFFRQKENTTSFVHAGGIVDMDPHLALNFKEEKQNSVLVKCNHSPFLLQQKEKMEDVFNGYIYPIASKDCIIEGNIIVRSDDFIDGPLNRPFTLSIQSD
jgi:hypothetical protein